MYEPTGADLRIGRLLMGLTTSAACQQWNLSAMTLAKLEAGGAVRPEIRMRAWGPMHRAGVRFEAPGIVTWFDPHMRHQRRAPTPAVVGKLTGKRLADARLRLRVSRDRVAARGRVTYEAVARIEAAGLADVRRGGVSPVAVYAVFGALESLGFVFGPNARRDKVIPAAAAS